MYGERCGLSQSKNQRVLSQSNLMAVSLGTLDAGHLASLISHFIIGLIARPDTSEVDTKSNYYTEDLSAI